jgi:hypothetical protein
VPFCFSPCVSSCGYVPGLGPSEQKNPAATGVSMCLFLGIHSNITNTAMIFLLHICDGNLP